MLASIIANLQNQPQPEPRFNWKTSAGRSDHGDRSDRGDQRWAGYELVDIIAAMASFQEVPGEHPGARTARRRRWIGEALPNIKEARERREGAAFLAGAVVADAAAEERHKEAAATAEERHRLVDQLKIEQLVAIIDEVRGGTPTPAALPAPQFRGQYASKSMGVSPIMIALGVGVVLGIGLATSPRRKQKRRR